VGFSFSESVSSCLSEKEDRDSRMARERGISSVTTHSGNGYTTSISVWEVYIETIRLLYSI